MFHILVGKKKVNLKEISKRKDICQMAKPKALTNKTNGNSANNGSHD